MHYGPGDTNIYIETNDEKVRHRCGGERVIQTQPNITYHCSKRPVTDYTVHAIQRYGDKTNNRVERPPEVDVAERIEDGIHC
ncbi:hypothetical protein DPMN_094933 [Dreissena polymorpha]|uniref:Uncharacterized protein n=1 Tax=Dreissena polymorpha TaxID=45954 RepID=A0A9D4L6Z6_DREPO|nr:hypothetical protein DPMN_094933 [Dreissena polymorpha]